jgi:hypothetical protein
MDKAFIGICTVLIAFIGIHMYTLIQDEPEIPDTPPTTNESVKN